MLTKNDVELVTTEWLKFVMENFDPELQFQIAAAPLDGQTRCSFCGKGCSQWDMLLGQVGAPYLIHFSPVMCAIRTQQDE